jgi:hypothetical protein
MNRLGTITHNNKRNRVRDLVFAAFIALSAAIAVTAMAEDFATQLTQR